MTEPGARAPSTEPVRVRFAPSPSGDLHVGNVRTALYNWAFARHFGGTLVFRIEDTDRSRVSDEAAAGAADTLRWLGLDWDEGPQVGGPHAPYHQSQRIDRYDEWLARFLADGWAYRCYCTPEEVAARNAAAGRPPGYDNHCRSCAPEQAAALEAAGRRPVVRFRMPEGATTFFDLIRGEVTFDHEHVPDFVLVRADGHSLYTLAVAVDDVLMGITHVLRGEDLLSSTPRQIAVYQAMGVPPARRPRFGHLPFVLGPDHTKLSKRHGELSVAWYRRQGFLPEALANYLALLGWSLPSGAEVFSLPEMAEAFTLERVNRNPARFDLKKLEALNGDWIRRLPGDEFATRVLHTLQAAGLIAHPVTESERGLVSGAAPLVQERLTKLSEVVGMLGFLFVDDAHFEVDEQAAARVFLAGADTTLRTARGAVADLPEWTIDAIHQALERALVTGLGQAKRAAYGPVRVAVTGRQVSPPLFESIELLGRDRTLRRLDSAVALLAAVSSPPSD